FEVTVRDVTDSLVRELASIGVTTRPLGLGTAFEVEGDHQLKDVLEKTLAAGAKLDAVLPKRETLEDVFVRRAL
ncbi:MAG TPA: ABC transporter ATP-binding protein, partial [Polyangiaceae bacterium]